RGEHIAIVGIGARVFRMVQADEAKQFILNHWESRRESKLISSSYTFFCGGAEDIVGRIQSAIVVIQVKVTVKLVGSRFRLDQNHRAIASAKLGSVIFGDYLKFLDS